MRQQKTHLYRSHGDHRAAGQTQHEYTHSTACGYVREAVTTDSSGVTCKLCLREMAKGAPPTRRFRGPGYLEQTGYIPAGSSAEREGLTPNAALTRGGTE